MAVNKLNQMFALLALAICYLTVAGNSALGQTFVDHRILDETTEVYIWNYATDNEDCFVVKFEELSDPKGWVVLPRVTKECETYYSPDRTTTVSQEQFVVMLDRSIDMFVSTHPKKERLISLNFDLGQIPSGWADVLKSTSGTLHRLKGTASSKPFKLERLVEKQFETFEISGELNEMLSQYSYSVDKTIFLLVAKLEVKNKKWNELRELKDFGLIRPAFVYLSLINRYYPESESLRSALETCDRFLDSTGNASARRDMPLAIERLTRPDAAFYPQARARVLELLKDEKYRMQALNHMTATHYLDNLNEPAKTQFRTALRDIVSDKSNEIAARQSALSILKKRGNNAKDYRGLVENLIRIGDTSGTLATTAMIELCRQEAPLSMLDEYSTLSLPAKIGYMACLLNLSRKTHGTFSDNDSLNQQAFQLVWNNSSRSTDRNLRLSAYHVLGQFVFPQLKKYDERRKRLHISKDDYVKLPDNFLAELRKRQASETDDGCIVQIKLLIMAAEELK